MNKRIRKFYKMASNIDGLSGAQIYYGASSPTTEPIYYKSQKVEKASSFNRHSLEYELHVSHVEKHFE